MDSSLIACSVWVAQGVAKRLPDKVELNPEQLQALIVQGEQDLADLEAGQLPGDDEDPQEQDEEEEEQQPAQRKNPQLVDMDPIISQYGLDDYDNEEEDPFHTGLTGLAMYASNKDDPLVTVKDEDDEDEQDLQVHPNENLIVVGQTEDVYSRLDVYAYNEEDDNLFHHHDIMLESYPLCIEWLDFDPGSETSGNLIAVGTMTPQIEFWDLDVISSLEPAFVLGDKKQKKKKKPPKQTHCGEVMGLAWNKLHRNFFASASADTTVRLWDLSEGTCLRTFCHHNDKVQTVSWNPQQGPVVLTGSFDQTAAAFDTRAPEAVSTWEFSADISCALWNPFTPETFLTSCEDGMVYCCDTRQPGKTVFRLNAHDEDVSALAFSQHVPQCLATGSADKEVKVWDLAEGKPTFVCSRQISVGPVYTLSFSPDSPFVVSGGGLEGGLKVFDLAENGAVRRQFADRIPEAAQAALEKKAKEERPPTSVAEELPYAEDEDDESWEDILESMHITSHSAAPRPNKAMPRKSKPKKSKKKKSS
eukprot:m.89422 g.89422  ORF g.89422 m.89422 type:complete len:531 (+) comp21518_c1_seq1:1-1593(+)